MSQLSRNEDVYEDDDAEDLLFEANHPLIEQTSDLKDGTFPKARQILALVGFAGFAIVYAMRVNLSISIVSMVNHTAINTNTNQSTTDVCPFPAPTNSTIPAVSTFNDFYCSNLILIVFVERRRLPLGRIQSRNRARKFLLWLRSHSNSWWQIS